METIESRAEKNIFIVKTNEIVNEFISLLKNRYFYIGLLMLITGIQLNFLSQSYLQQYVNEGKTLPVLTDIILDNLPYWDIDYLYDIFSLVSIFTIAVYIIHRRKYSILPYVFLLCGMFHITRGVFIVLTPLGNPAMFDGTQGLFNGFSKYELGVYPSGHVGIAYLYFILCSDRYYRIVLLASVFVIIGALFLSRGHYSIDILSGIFFAYAIKAYADKRLKSYFVRKEKDKIMKIKQAVKAV
ncbi:MAG: hypothetical protein JXR34_07865 [Bacteroidales bacterium]|nr:hypothetical protein [Bacteroidales bacterium]